MTRTRKTTSIVLALALLSVSCIHKTGGTVTTREKLATYNAAFAQANNEVERGIEAVTISPTNPAGLITAKQAMPVILWTGQVAAAHQQVTAIIAKGSVTSADLVSVGGLLDQIKTSGNILIASGILGIKNPATQQAFTADFNSIYTLADAIVTLLTTLKVGQ